MRYIKTYFLAIICLLFSNSLSAHPMPNSVVLLDIKGSKVDAELQLPLNELELAFGHKVNQNTDQLIERLGPELKAYLMQHIQPVTNDGRKWAVSINSMMVEPVQNSPSGPYKELTVHLSFIPPSGSDTRNFVFNYDVIIHQVVTHYALVSLRQDWDNGLSGEHSQEVGIIQLDIPSNKILPLKVNLREGNLWKGFWSMLNLGMDHIKEGTDHLLFLLTLLLPATLLISAKRWGKFAGVKHSLIRIFKIVTAFTIGHSITLLIGSTGWIHFPGQPIEVLIAVSILVSATHAVKPLFPGKEIYIAAGFGLIHGMAFAETLVNLHLDVGRTALSIFGFNLGIELMQIFIIAITIPWLIILSRNNTYSVIRVAGASAGAIASVAWIIERISGNPNWVSKFVQSSAVYDKWIIVALGLAAFASYFVTRKDRADSSAKSAG